MQSEILMVGQNLDRFVDAFADIDPGKLTMSVFQVSHPVDYILKHTYHQPEGMIVRLEGDETEEDLRAACLAFPGSSLAFVTDRQPSAVFVEGILGRYGATFHEPAEDPLMVIAAVADEIFNRRRESDRRRRRST